MHRIVYDDGFVKEYQSLSRRIQRKLEKAVALFRENPFHLSLRLHKLSGKLAGLWSISLDRRYRLIFEVMENGDILFVSVGTHAIYE